MQNRARETAFRRERYKLPRFTPRLLRIDMFVIDHTYVYVTFYFVCRTDVGPLSLIKPPRLINHRPIFAPVLRQSWEDRDDVSSQIES